jgi:hypothetical protein
MRGPPVLVVQMHTIFASVGDEFLIFFEATSIPFAERVYWTLNGNIIKNNQNVIEMGDGSHVRTTLRIKTAEKDQFGTYLCHIENEFEKTTGRIHVEEIGNDFKTIRQNIHNILSFQSPCPC